MENEIYDGKPQLVIHIRASRAAGRKQTAPFSPPAIPVHTVRSRPTRWLRRRQRRRWRWRRRKSQPLFVTSVDNWKCVHVYICSYVHTCNHTDYLTQNQSRGATESIVHINYTGQRSETPPLPDQTIQSPSGMAAEKSPKPVLENGDLPPGARKHPFRLPDLWQTIIHSVYRKRMTMHDMSSLLFLANASVVRRLAAARGSLTDFTRSTASWFFITCQTKGWTLKPSHAFLFGAQEI